MPEIAEKSRFLGGNVKRERRENMENMKEMNQFINSLNKLNIDISNSKMKSLGSRMTIRTFVTLMTGE